MKIEIEGKEYEIDLEKAKKLGLTKEEVEKLEPKRLNKYYSTGTVQPAYSCIDVNDVIDNRDHMIGNYFETEDQAKLMYEKTYDIWYKIRAWAVRNDAILDYKINGGNNYIHFDMNDKTWSVGFSNFLNRGEIFMSIENCKKIVKILNDGNYRP